MSLQLLDCEGVLDHGTLLWVGDRDEPAFREAYDFCEAHVAQLAYRRDLNSALHRPSTSVRTILCCRNNDSAESREWFHMLCRLHRDAKAFLLLGPLCAGARPSPSDLFGVPTIAWHQWESVLPGYLRRCGWANRPAERPESIAVVASSSANASALLSIASCGDATSLWCRPDQRSRLRNFDQVWWDDSATLGRSWTELMSQLCESPKQHVWISSDVTPRSKQAALAAGCELVIAKPGDFSLLIDRAAGANLHRSRRAA